MTILTEDQIKIAERAYRNMTREERMWILTKALPRHAFWEIREVFKQSLKRTKSQCMEEYEEIVEEIVKQYNIKDMIFQTEETR